MEEAWIAILITFVFCCIVVWSEIRTNNRPTKDEHKMPMPCKCGNYTIHLVCGRISGFFTVCPECNAAVSYGSLTTKEAIQIWNKSLSRGYY